jgi:hypothetical protein
MRFTLLFASLPLFTAACGSNPCDAYVDAICDCAGDAQCEATKTTYENADADLQDQCSANLDQAEDGEDAACDGEDTGV